MYVADPTGSNPGRLSKVLVPLHAVMETFLADEPPVRSVVIDKDGDAWQRAPADMDDFDFDPNQPWMIAGGAREIDMDWPSLNQTFGPLTTIHTP